MRLTELAKGQPCSIQLDGICNRDPSTTVAAHFRSVKFGSGMGIKPPDWLSAHACSACHDEVDWRTHHISRIVARAAHAYGVLVTLERLIRAGQLEIVVKP